MKITVLFTNQRYRQYLTVYSFICDLKKYKWGELDIHEILWEGNSYDLRRFLHRVVLNKVKDEFFDLLGETSYKVVIDLLSRLLIAGDEHGIVLLRDTIFYILEDEVFMACGDEDFDEVLQKLNEVKEYLECFYFNRG